MKPRVYIETTVVSYFTARPSRDLVVAAHQQITRDWWNQRLPLFDAAVSDLVFEEAGRGDPDAARERLASIDAFPILDVGSEVPVLAQALVDTAGIPLEFVNDAVHIAIAAVNGIDFLVTWNCKHLANAVIRSRIARTVEAHGYACPVVCTPEELMEELS